MTAVLLLLALVVQAQVQTPESKPKFEIALTGQFLVSTDFASVYFNFV